jgi:tRNA(fMet)-specific endonuclease VapC
MKYMLDTDMCIYIIKQKPKNVLHKFLLEMSSGICISSITLGELEFGVKNSLEPVKNEKALLQFLAPLDISEFGRYAAFEYGDIRAHLKKNGQLIGPLDMLIAAHARSEALVLVTNNTREFERVPGLEIENWSL